MKKVLPIVISLFVGICGTIVVIRFIPQKTIVETVKSEVNITESDTVAPAVDKIYDAVVTVENYTNVLQSLGTGFVYKTDDTYGYILTNNHVITGASSIKLLNNKGETAEATVLGSDIYVDLAVLRVKKEFVMKVATIGTSSDIKIGDTVLTVGTPIDLEYAGTVTKGIISATNRTVSVNTNKSNPYMMDVIQTTASINPGNSGGPLVNINGEVIGINTLKLVDDEIEGMGFAIPIEMATAVVNILEAGNTIERPYLGITSLSANNSYQLYRNGLLLDKDYDKGVVVFSTEPGSIAEKSGLQKKDIILKIDDYEIKDSAHFRYILYKYKIGDTITITYERDGEEKTVQAQLNKKE